MKKLWYIGLCFFLTPFCSAEEFTVNDLSGGMYSNYSPNQIPDNAAVRIQNMFTDVQPLAIERNGYEKRDSTQLGDGLAVTGLWEFQDNSGNQWIISFSSRTYYKNTIGGTPTAFGPNTTVAQVPDCTVNLGKIWCVDGTDELWWFDGVSTGGVSGAPLGKLIEPWRNRLVIGWITGSLSTLRFSEDGDGTSWTLAGNATDPFSTQIGGANDGYNITCLYGTYLDNLIIGRKYDLWAFTGFDQLDVVNRNISSEIGCIQDGSVNEFDGSLIFMSNRGMEELRGSIIQHISEPVRDIIDPLVQNTNDAKINYQTSGNDWDAGTLSVDISSTIVDGDLRSKTTSFLITSANDFSNATYSDEGLADWTTYNTIQSVFPDTFNYYRDGTNNTKAVWQTVNGSNSSCSGSVSSDQLLVSCIYNPGYAVNGRFCAIDDFPTLTTNGVTYYFQITDIEGPVWGRLLNRINFQLSDEQCENDKEKQLSVEIEPQTASTFKVTAMWEQESNGGTPSEIGSDSGTTYNFPGTFLVFVDKSNMKLTVNGSLDRSGTHTISGNPKYPLFSIQSNSATGGTEFRIDNFSISYQTFTFTNVHNTGIVSPIWANFYSDYSSTGITLESAASTDDVSYDAYVSITTGSAIGSDSKQYLKIKGTYELSISSSDLPGTVISISSYNFNAGSSGTFTSQVFEIGNDISSWGPIYIDDTQIDGTIVYQYNSTNSASIGDFQEDNWETLSSGDVPTISVSSYAAFRATFTVNTGTGTSALHEFETNWNTGSTNQVKSSIVNRRYWLAYTTSTASGSRNDSTLVYQRNRSWTLLKGINAASFTTWRDQTYFGDSNDNGYVYLYGSGNDDDGSGIESVIVTKSYDLDNFSVPKRFGWLYTNFNSNANNTGSFTVQYDLDQSGTYTSLGTMAMTDVQPADPQKLPFPISNRVEGREIQYRIAKTGQDTRLKLFDLTTIFNIKRRR